MNKRQIQQAITALQRNYAHAHAGEVTSTGKPKKSGLRSRHVIDQGLMLYISHTGECAFHFRGTYGGQEFTKRLCRYNPADHDGSYSRARELVNQYRQWLDEGRDPRVMYETAKQTQQPSLKEVIEIWLKIRKPAALDAVRRSFQLHIFPHVADGATPCDAVTEQHWRRIFSHIIINSGGATAKRLLRLLKAAARVARIHLGANMPALEQLRVADLGVKSNSRSRVLSLAELQSVETWTHNGKGPTYYRNLSRVLLATAARTQEVRLSRLDEWDLKDMVWTVPAEHSKGGFEIYRPIPKHLQPLIRSLVASARLNRSPYLLGELKEENTVSQYGRTLHKRLALAHFTFHDIRRSVATILQDAGVPAEVRESLLGHGRDVITATYQRGRMLNAKRDALAKLHLLITGAELAPVEAAL